MVLHIKGISKLFLLGIFVLFLLAGCKSGGNASHLFPTEDATEDDEEILVRSVQLLISSPQLASADTETVTLTAVVKDNNNVLREGVNVSFSADADGSIQVIRGLTDATGTAEAILSTTGNKTNRTINVSATAGGVSDTTTVQVIGTRINVAGADTAVLGDSVPLTFTLVDSAGTGIAGTTLSVSSAEGNTISDSRPVTNVSGKATIMVTAVVSGTDMITVAGAGATSVHTLEVSTDSFAFIAPLPPPEPVQEVPLNTDLAITVRWATFDGAPFVSQQVDFTATRGTLSAASVFTNANGEATVTISADNAGPSVITANAVGGPSAQLEILFIATTAASMTLQAEPAIIGPNPPGGTAEQSTIVAVVRDPDNHLVKGKTVNFSVSDVTGGGIFPASAVTDAFGQASTVYTAGTFPSGFDGVEVRAVVAGTAIEETVRLTVAEKKLFITLGTGNEIQVPDPTRYAHPYNVLVTDAAGNPVANAELTLSILPLSYFKGFYVKTFKTVAGEEVFDGWEQIVTAGSCANEDVNKNGILDPGEDFNNNGVLDPGNVATVSPKKATTDASGFAFFDVLYAQQFANWVQVELTARATVFGGEATEKVRFILAGVADDFNREDVNPPGNPSPFGTSSTCADDL